MTNGEYIFRQLDVGGIDRIMELQEEAFSVLGDASLLRRNSREMLLECLSEPHYTLGAFRAPDGLSGEILAGFGILYHGGDTDENLSLFMENSPPPEKCANIKLIIVKPTDRGHGLQRRLTERLEAEAKTRGYKLLCATVSPDNSHSLANFERMGYGTHGRFKKYGGLERLLLYKYI